MKSFLQGPGGLGLLLGAIAGLTAGCGAHEATESNSAGLTSSHEILLPPLAPDERESLNEGDKESGEPMQVGLARELSEADQTVPLSTLTWTEADGQKRAQFSLRSPDATSLRLGLEMAGEGCDPLSLTFLRAGSDSGESVSGSAVRRIKDVWWSPVIEGDTARVRLTHPADGDIHGCALRIPLVSHLI